MGSKNRVYKVGRRKRSLFISSFSVLFKHKHQNKNKNMLNNTEKSMIPIIRSCYESLSVSQKDMDALEEFSAGTGIADLVLFKPNEKELKKRLSRHLPSITNSKDLKVIQSIQIIGNQTNEQIARNCKLPQSTTNDILLSLIDKGVVESTKKGYRLLFSIRSNTDRSIAIEAKIKDWRSGIKQALRYKEFAQYVYLAMYDDKIEPCLAKEDMFKQLGVGLIGVSNSGIKEYIKPQYNHREIIEFNELLASERYLSIINESEQSFVVRNNFAS